MKGKKFIAIISIVCILAVILCVPAFATVTESDGDGFVLYNGVKLPDIDTVWIDKDAYPYAILFIHVDTHIPTLVVFKEFVVADSTSVSYYTPAIAFSLSNDVWEHWITTTNRRYLTDLNVFWVSTDMTDQYGNIVIPYTSPIPLDGYNIIEWDGDTDSLTTWENFYIVHDYVSAVDGIAVFNSSSGLVIAEHFINDTDGWALQTADDYTSDKFTVLALDPEGIGADYDDANNYTSLIAYRTVEEPPGEGGDTPDEPQPPFGAAEIYLKLHLLALTLQRK